jgi:DNA modification methylase
MTTLAGDWVLDPFNGAGATTKAAVDLRRRALGFDISPQYVEMARYRLGSDSQVRQRQLHVRPVTVPEFQPTASRGETRHGTGPSARRRSEK